MGWTKGQWKWHLKQRYGITEEQYNTILESQAGVCAICEMPERAKFNGKTKRLAVDHCHKSGIIRGLLCNRCNGLLAILREDKDWMLSAIGYLN